MQPPDDAALGAQLRRLAHMLYVDGTIGPSMAQYNLHRPESWPSARELLRSKSYPILACGWRRLLALFGLYSPTRWQARIANRRHFSRSTEHEVYDEARLRRIAAYDDTCLHGEWVERDVWEWHNGQRVLVRHREFRLR